MDKRFNIFKNMLICKRSYCKSNSVELYLWSYTEDSNAFLQG